MLGCWSGARGSGDGDGGGAASDFGLRANDRSIGPKLRRERRCAAHRGASDAERKLSNREDMVSFT
jgi:hypothetical protein